MKVETYELKDVQDETPEQCEEAKQLIEQLGLEGQKVKTETGTRFPYRMLTDEESFVYKHLCPEISEVEKFSNEPIPLDVLKTLAFAKSLGGFCRFEVWSASSVKVKDPVLIGYYGVDRWSAKPYLLARWGLELLPLEVLLPDAIKIAWAERVQKLNEIKRDINAALEQQLPLSHTGVRMPYIGGL